MEIPSATNSRIQSSAISLTQRCHIHLEGMTISYLRKNNMAKRTIFFFHGNSNSADLWANQFSDISLEEYSLIAFDLPGHGESTILQDITKCNLICFAEILSKCVIEMSAGQPYILCGLSLGGNIVAEMIATAVNPVALVLVGSNLVGEGIKPSDIITDSLVNKVLYTNSASLEDVGTYLKRISVATNQIYQGALLKDYLKVDPRFREGFADSIARGEYSDEINLIRNFGKPVLLVFGAIDSICSTKLLTELLSVAWTKTICTIADASHLVVLDQPQKFNNLLKQFLEEVYSD